LGVWPKRIACFLTFFLLISIVEASEDKAPVRLFNEGSYLLNLHMDVLKDTSNTLTIDQVSDSNNKLNFIKNDQEILNLGITPNSYWIRFSLYYPLMYPNKDKEKKWYLEVGRSLLDMAELYTPLEGGGYALMRSDLSMPFEDRYVAHVNSLFPVELLIGEERTFFLKVKNISTSIQFPLILWTPEAFVEKVSTEEFIVGIFFGSMIVLLLYNFFLFFAVKDICYLYYVGYLGGVTMFQLLEIGHGAIHSGRLFEIVGKEWISVVIWIASMSGVQFFKVFVEVRKGHPLVERALNIFLGISAISLFLSIFKNDFVSIIWVSLFAVVLMGSMLAMSVFLWFKGNENAMFFCLAWVCNIVGFIVYSLMANGFLPSTALTLLSAPLGIVLEALLLSFALADRIKRESKKALVADRNTMNYLTQFRSVFDNSREGMYQMTIFGKINNANKSLARMMGFSNVGDMLSGNSYASNRIFGNNQDNYKNLIEKGVVRNEMILDKDGSSPVWIIHNAKLIYDDAGGAQHIEGSVVDVSDEKEKGIAINEELKERIERKIAAMETEQKSKFLSVMSHQIRTPLTSVIGFGELIQEPWIEGSEKLSCVDMIVENSRELLQLINNILDYSKMEAGKFYVECVVVNTIDTVNSLSTSFLEKAKEKSLDFEIKIAYPMPDKIKGDPTRILQVANNLCSNAIRFTERGKVTVAFSWADDRLTLSVSDTGVGMKKEKLREVLNGGITEDGGNLGLPISKKLAEMMGGGICVSSEEGGGSVFEFTALGELAKDASWINGPTDAAVKGAYRNGFEEKSGQSVASKRRKKGAPALSGRVLLAEDNVVNQKLIERVLKKTGVDVVVANDGLEACYFCCNEKFDFVLMDINMPNRNGIEATEYLRKRQYGMPIYALTAETDQSEIDKILDAGCEGFLTKPLNKTHLYEVMEELLPNSEPKQP